MRERLRALLATGESSEGFIAAAPPVPVREIFRRFWPYARPYRKWLAFSLIFIMIGPAIDAAMIWMFKIVVDEVLVPRDFDAFWWIAAAYVGLTVLSGIVDFIDEYVSTWVGQRFLLDLRTRLFSHLQSLPLGFFERRRQGDLLARLTGDISAIESLVLSGVADFLSYVFSVLFFTAALFYLQWDLALISLVVAPLFWTTSKRFSQLIRTASRERRRRSGSLTAVAEESLGNVQVVQAYNRQDFEVQRYRREAVGSFRATMASMRLRALFTPIVTLIELLGALVVIGFGTYKLSQGDLSLGGLLAFMTYLTRLYDPIRSLTKLTTTIYSASAGAERVLELLDEQPAVTDRPGARDLGRARGAVRADGISYRYPGTERDAVSDVSFTVGPGETLALVGGSGAGKSTIAKLLLRFHEPDTGTISVDGHDVRELTLHSLRENIAVLLQETLVFEGTVRENIAYGRPGASDEEIERAARAADAHEFVVALPDGYDTPIGERGRRLSGGQRQRIAIARAMVRDAPILILDEPTTGLDNESTQRVMAPMKRLMEGRTTIVISHNLMTVRSATEIVVLDHGRIAERGTHDVLLARDGAYAQMWRSHDEEAATAGAPTE
ncbi:MAG TPA: ABC transporter ATP-binding protein [Solirubrobacteraceae bacterium]|jgi:ATP-binding cassette, subfamily B, bacterial|nr:ABC transporter ATP-binding protein [Solirubrobacteraceae bacterium]